MEFNILEEEKTVDTFVNPGFFEPGHFILLNRCVTGTNFYNRIGNHISLTKLYIRGHIQPITPLPGNTSDYLRMMIIYDRQPNQITPIQSDLLRDFNYNGTGATNEFSNLNPNNKLRFTCLWEQVLVIPSTNNSLSTNFSSSIIDYSTKPNVDTWIGLRDLKTTYNTLNVGNIVDFTTGALFLYLTGSLPEASYGYFFEGQIRLYFRDS